MSVESIGKYMPEVITLDDLAIMISADTSGRRYEMSPEGALSVVPPPDSDHAVIASRLMIWLITVGWPVDQVVQALGIQIPGSDGDGGRIPDLTVWSKPLPTSSVWLPASEVVLAVEIVSRGSEAIDKAIKPLEYATAGIPHYWTVSRDTAQTVTRHRLGPDQTYRVVGQTPLAWLLQTTSAEHLLPGY